MYGGPHQQSYPRMNSFRGTKQQVLGHNSNRVQPAWRGQASASKGKQPAAAGSKILLSKLPLDVADREIEELFKKTVGHVKESFLIYNSQGRSKGMAIVVFAKPGDALVARDKYDGKIVDGRRPIKIELVYDGQGPSFGGAAPAPQQPSLFERLGPTPSTPSAPTGPKANGANNHMLPRQAAALAKNPEPTIARPRRRTKKGPKRLKKQQLVSKSADQLDREMEDYRAQADTTPMVS